MHPDQAQCGACSPAFRWRTTASEGIIASSSIGPGTVVVQVRDSIVASNTGHGIFASTPGGPTVLTAFVVDRSSSLLNSGDGIRAQGPTAVVHLGNSTVIGNGGGLIALEGGQILSYQNNQASGNLAGRRPNRRAHREVGMGRGLGKNSVGAAGFEPAPRSQNRGTSKVFNAHSRGSWPVRAKRDQ